MTDADSRLISPTGAERADWIALFVSAHALRLAAVRLRAEWEAFKADSPDGMQGHEWGFLLAVSRLEHMAATMKKEAHDGRKWGVGSRG